jgi:hypothetical protein
MVRYDYNYKAYIAGDGNYGVDAVITFDYEEFENNYPGAWSALDSVHDSTRIELVMAILDQDEETIRELCEENELNPLDFLD